MAIKVQENWDIHQEEDELHEEEEEALSLCDLPLTFINHNKDQDPSTKEESHVVNETQQEDFDFRSWGSGGLFSKEQEMCAADDVFFQGQILPLRLSFSSEAGLLNSGFQFQHNGKQFNRCKSRFGSLDHASMSQFRSSSSRSSSIRSQNSSSSTSSTTTTTTPIVSKPNKIGNQFHTIPSPKPQLRAPRHSNYINQGRKSSTWEFFRLGVAPAPEIGLQDLKVRSTNSANKNSVSRNSSSSSSSGSNNVKTTKKTHRSDKGYQILKHFGLLSGCDCSIETVQSNMVMIKSGSGIKSTNKIESTTHAMKEKVVELKKQKHRQKQGKKVMSRRRTFEWLKELHASDIDEEALLSKQ